MRYIITSMEILLLIYIGYRLHEVDVICVDLSEKVDHHPMKMQKEDWIQPVLRIDGFKHNISGFTHWFAEYNNAVKYVFHLLGYRLEINGTVFQDDGTITDRIYKRGVPWTVDHPESPDKVIDMIPGLNEYVTYKASLVTRGGKYIPKGFHLPQDNNSFMEYTSKPENKNKIWIQKNPRHRETTSETYRQTF
ncbi:uncharacterized protein [Amphiura filiformis]|uniref:uncharacterized protein n=1 Tax=Amphiura filiformis TaxID=82378 RepID=UPI003B216392